LRHGMGTMWHAKCCGAVARQRQKGAYAATTEAIAY
jgi:hypothetical protein